MKNLPIAMVLMTRLLEKFCRSSPIMTFRTKNHPSYIYIYHPSYIYVMKIKKGDKFRMWFANDM
ncbi:unnamed protein product, partial [Larinioides sclopetarius]